ncbi:MAG: hypothetical protein ACYS3N_20330, partial [Planctomycetota bacterium]
RGLIAKTSEPKVGFLPVKDPENIRLSDIAEAVSVAGFAQSAPDQPQTLEQINRSQRSALAQYSLKQILNVAKDSGILLKQNHEGIVNKEQAEEK